MKKLLTYLSFATLALAGYWNHLNQQHQGNDQLNQIIKEASQNIHKQKSEDLSVKQNPIYWVS